MAYNYQFPYQQQPIQQIQPVVQQSIQNNGLVIVRGEAEARNYPVGYGNSVTFKDETSPYIYTKTMGFSQLDRPVFEKFKLVKEESDDLSPEIPKVDNTSIDELKGEISALWNEIKALKERRQFNRKGETKDE